MLNKIFFLMQQNPFSHFWRSILCMLDSRDTNRGRRRSSCMTRGRWSRWSRRPMCSRWSRRPMCSRWSRRPMCSRCCRHGRLPLRTCWYVNAHWHTQWRAQGCRQCLLPFSVALLPIICLSSCLLITSLQYQYNMNKLGKLKLFLF